MLAQTTLDAAAISRIGRTAYEQNRAPGFSLAVWYKGKVVFANGYGYSDVAAKTPVMADTRFPIGSITKQFTAVSIMLLAERGRILLDDKLNRFLPEMPNADKITLRMLLNQTSGLHNYPLTSEHSWPLEGQIDSKSIFAILKTDRPDFPPGERWEYSNTNYAALAEVVAKSSGLSFDQFVQQNIFTPLLMTTSGVGYQAQKEIATPYEGTAGNFAPVPVQLSLDLFYGAGNIVSSANDLIRWDAALIGGRLLNPAAMRELWTAGRLANGQLVNYAMGFVPASIAGHRELWHNGYTPLAGGYCLNAIFPDDQLAVVVLSNSPDAVFQGMPEQMVHEIIAMIDPHVSTSQQVASMEGTDEDSRTRTLARTIFEEISAGRVDRSILSPEMDADLTPARLAQSARQMSALGRLIQMTLRQKTTLGNGSSVYYVYLAFFTGGVRQILITITNDGRVNSFQVVP
ncbi:serine hydrolase domain-containing protein [Alloacidobacterium sp.]|uniref:serine hydrolase domain-containing protein n=1 Tax=Alloacidobacterium sp. TaxID=2951999 RepID=UPI002D317D38|nr:serine hydrolase domain-containing protein [Alloacidobacterium sp.]HYK35144.1 serine hydrolase domain-containing protein [Alloacidobacterium sp.]